MGKTKNIVQPLILEKIKPKASEIFIKGHNENFHNEGLDAIAHHINTIHTRNTSDHIVSIASKTIISAFFPYIPGADVFIICGAVLAESLQYVKRNEQQKIKNNTYNSYYDTEEFIKKRQKEVDNNYDFFISILNDIIKEHRDEFVLIKNKKIVAYFTTYSDANKYGKSTILDNIYSIQEVTDEAIDLGIFSNVTI